MIAGHDRSVLPRGGVRPQCGHRRGHRRVSPEHAPERVSMGIRNLKIREPKSGAPATPSPKFRTGARKNAGTAHRLGPFPRH
jgi:hypothetical protein